MSQHMHPNDVFNLPPPEGEVRVIIILESAPDPSNPLLKNVQISGSVEPVMSDNMMDNPAYTYAEAMRNLIDYANLMKRHPAEVINAIKEAIAKGILLKRKKPNEHTIIRLP